MGIEAVVHASPPVKSVYVSLNNLDVWLWGLVADPVKIKSLQCMFLWRASGHVEGIEARLWGIPDWGGDQLTTLLSEASDIQVKPCDNIGHGRTSKAVIPANIQPQNLQVNRQ